MIELVDPNARLRRSGESLPHYRVAFRTRVSKGRSN